MNEGDDQEIETVLFDALDNGEVVAEDLWAKVSWLSFFEEDSSLRVRFSFGMDHVGRCLQVINDVNTMLHFCVM